MASSFHSNDVSISKILTNTPRYQGFGCA